MKNFFLLIFIFQFTQISCNNTIYLNPVHYFSQKRDRYKVELIWFDIKRKPISSNSVSNNRYSNPNIPENAVYFQLADFVNNLESQLTAVQKYGRYNFVYDFDDIKITKID